VRSLDEIVWAVNPKSDTLSSLMEYISHFASEFFENASTRCRLEIPDDVPDCSLNSEIRHGLFLVVKEALNNVLKHAQASEVHIHIFIVASTLKISIADNGCGFAPDENAPDRKRNGLENMRKRIEGFGGEFSIESQRGGGTRLTLKVKLN
jgi:signal transduction histidine kinase